MTKISQIPRNGRIGRFAKIIEKEFGEKVLLKTMQDSDKYEDFKAAKRSEWWRLAIERLEKEIGQEKAKNIMRLCGQKCCGTGNRKTAKRLMAESKSIEEFLEKSSNYGVKPGQIEYRLKNKNTIIGTFNRCFCKQVSKAPTPFKNKTYCQCSVEFHQQFFQVALEKSVKVELTQSIISGADSCRFIIKI